MKIGIVGSGNIGGTLTRRLTTLGHDVTVANSRGPDSLTSLAAETGARAGTVAEAAKNGEVVVVAIPLRAISDLPADVFRDRIVVDTGNYYPQRDGTIAPIANGSATSSRWVADQLPGARVIKAFNNILAQHLLDRGRAAGEPGRIALPVAGDDEEARRLVLDLVEELGFDPIDAGPLDESWRQQPNTPVSGTDLDAEGVRAGLASARP
jgi:predicted dinucleotide-binding enzyme